MDVDSWIAQLESDGDLLAAAAARAGWDAPVPGLEWDVRTLVTHTAGVHRWAADCIRTHATGFGTAADDDIGTGPGDGDLLDWFRSGLAALAQVLRDAPDDVEVFTFLPAATPRGFWCRRQAHETAIHRADAESAAGGPVTAFPPAFAFDGIDELIGGFAARRTRVPSEGATIALVADDAPPARIRLGGPRIELVAGEPPEGADARVEGSASDLYLWVWNRPSGAVVSGDESVAALWGAVRVR